MADSLISELFYLRNYSDSLINDSVHVVINDLIVGELISRQIENKAVYKQKTITEYIQVPVVREIPVEVKKTRFMAGIEATGNKHTLQVGPKLILTTKKGYGYSLGVSTNTSEAFVSVGVYKRF